VTLLGAALAAAGPSLAQERTAPAVTVPGQTADGFLLPNGWRLTPAGTQVPLTDLPLNIHPTRDGKHALVTTNGYNAHELTVVDLQTASKGAVHTVRQSWFGLAVDEATGRLWWSGGGEGIIHVVRWREGQLVAEAPLVPQLVDAAPPEEGKAQPAGPTRPPGAAGKSGKAADAPRLGFQTGMCLDPAGGTLFALTILPKGGNKSFAWGDATTDGGEGGVISRLNLAQIAESRSARCGKRPYDVVLARNGLLYVSDWADRAVLVVDPDSLRTIGRIPVGEHPNQLALHPKDGRLFVACASSNAVHVIDTARGTVQEVIVTSLFPQAPEGSTPDALCIAPDGETLYVANADNNCIAVIDIETPRQSLVKGFIPTGWYPTAVAITPDGKRLLVGVGKGNVSQSNKPEPA